MRKGSPPAMRICVRDFLQTVGVLPQWSKASTAERPSRGHYEWGHWSDALRSRSMWAFGGPWRSLIADIKIASLLQSVSELHRVKDQIVWEIVEQIYTRAEKARSSNADQETTKTRIRSVFSWQRRHDVKKHSLIWFIDFAFALSAYDEYQTTRLFRENVAFQDPAQQVSAMAPREVGRQAEALEREMLQAGFLPFYAKVGCLSETMTIRIRLEAATFCQGLNPPRVEMSMDVRETRGMPREEKAVDFTTPWLAGLAHEQHNQRWSRLLTFLTSARGEVGSPELWELLIAECSRAIVSCALTQIVMSDAANAGYVADIAHSTAVEQSNPDLLVPSRRVGQKRKRLVSRQSFRKVLESRLKQLDLGPGVTSLEGKYPGNESEGTGSEGSSEGPGRPPGFRSWQRDSGPDDPGSNTQVLLMAQRSICGFQASSIWLSSPMICCQESSIRCQVRDKQAQ